MQDMIAAIQARIDAIIEAPEPEPCAPQQRAIGFACRGLSDPRSLSFQELREVCSALIACSSDMRGAAAV